MSIRLGEQPSCEWLRNSEEGGKHQQLLSKTPDARVGSSVRQARKGCISLTGSKSVGKISQGSWVCKNLKTVTLERGN